MEDGYHVWSERFERTTENIFAIQDEITLAIVDKLKIKLLKQEKARLTIRRTHDHGAFQLYLRGRYHLNKRTETDLIKSLELFQQAIAKDPQFAVAHAGLADAYVALGWHNYRPGEFAYTRGKREALKTLELDDSVGEAHVSIALIKQIYLWDWAGADREYRQALKLYPSNAEARHQYSHLAALLGRCDEAIAEMTRALDLEPLSVVRNSCLGQNLYYARRFDEAIQQHQKAIEMDPHFYLPHLHIGYDYHQKHVQRGRIGISNSYRSLPGILPGRRARWGTRTPSRITGSWHVGSSISWKVAGNRDTWPPTSHKYSWDWIRRIRAP